MERVEVNKEVRVLFEKIGSGIIKDSKILAVKPGNALGEVLIKTNDGTHVATVKPYKDVTKADFVTDTVCAIGSTGYSVQSAIKTLGFKELKFK